MINVGFVQFAPVFGNPEASIASIEKLVQGISADLLVLPELANSGYNFSSVNEAYRYSEEISGSRFADFIISTARQKKMFIVTGFCERDGSKIYNSALLAGPGGIIGKYRKTHLFYNEKDFFVPGDLGLPVFNTEIGILGMLICFDWIFPEVWRILALKGTGMICHPSNLVLPWAQQAVPVHGLMNRTFIITCNRTGSEGELKFTGQSFISDPYGRTLKMASAGLPETGICSIEPEESDNKMATPRNHIFDDRRPELYEYLTRKQNPDK